MTAPFSEHLSEQWLLERTYHAYLSDGRELAVPDFTQAMKQLIDFSVPLSLQSWKSQLAERETGEKSTNFSVPLPVWGEISQEEARILFRQGKPILLYGEHTWEHQKGSTGPWRPNRNMSRIIYGDAYARSEAVSGTEYAVCYLDLNQGTFSNASWRAWFPSDVVAILDGSTPGTITFLTPSVQFPYSTHYTVVASDGHIHEYANRAEAIQGFDALSLQEVSNGSAVQAAVPPQLCYYHEVKCPSGMYRLEFFGPRMDEQGYRVREAVASHQ